MPKTATSPAPPVDPQDNPTLYFLSEQALADGRMLASLAELLDDPDTEALGVSLLEELIPAKERHSAALLEKANRAAWAVQSLKAVAEARKAQAARLSAMAASDARSAQRLEEYILDCLTAAAPDETSFDLGDHKFLSRRGDSLILEEGVTLAPEFLRFKDPEPDKTAIRAALKAGTVVEGASLVPSRTWRLA